MNNIAIQSKFINIYTHLVFFTLKRELKRPAYVAVWTCVTKLEISELCETKIMMFLYTKEYRKDKEPLKQGWNGIFGNSGVRHFLDKITYQDPNIQSQSTEQDCFSCPLETMLDCSVSKALHCLYSK